MSKCRRCHRELKREPYRSLGIGQICQRKENIESEKASAQTGDVIIPYDGGDIFIERCMVPNQFGGLTSRIKTNIQRKEIRHSPSGFEFGYGGSGPADTALNILLMFTSKAFANHIYQDFKWKYLAVAGDKIVIPKSEILSFIEKKAEETTVAEVLY